MSVLQYGETATRPAAIGHARPVLRRVTLPVSRVRLSADDRTVLLWWTLAHAAFAVLVWAASWTESPTKARGPVALERWHAVLRSWTASELLIGFVAGSVAMVALGRLAGDRRAAGYLLAAGASVFLFVGYSEALFLAFAVPAWLAAVRGRWAAAGLLAFGAAAVRPDGLFLILGLAVLALTAPGDAGRAGALARLSPALLAPAAYETYLVAATGRLDAWQRAQRAGWNIRFAYPWDALRSTYRLAFEHRVSALQAFAVQAELLAMAAGLAATAALLLSRRWAEAAYTGALFLSLACTTYYAGVPRALLVAFPLYPLLARAAARRLWAGWLYLSLSAPLAAVFALLYLTGAYAG